MRAKSRKREEGRIESNVFKQIVPDSVVVESAASTQDQLLCSEDVPRKAKTGPEIIGVFVPDIMVDLNGPLSKYFGGERAIRRKEDIGSSRHWRYRITKQNFLIEASPGVV